MNEEIERILNKIKKGAELTKIGEKEIRFPSGNKFVIFDDDDCRMMQDYINGLNQENARLKDNRDKLNNWLEERVKYLTEIDGQNIPLNDNFKFCSMNELYQTGKYSGFKETLEKIEVILKEN